MAGFSNAMRKCSGANAPNLGQVGLAWLFSDKQFLFLFFSLKKKKKKQIIHIFFCSI